MARKLTTKFVENVKPGPVRQEISDAGSGLYLVLQSSGHRSWALRYRHGGRPAKLTIGAWPAVSLLDARKAAADAQHALARGNDPAKAKVDARIKADAAKADTLTNICESYLRREGKKLRTFDQRVSILKRLVYPALGSRPISEIRRSEIVALLDRIEDGSGERMADVTLAVLRKIMRWHATRDDDFRSPIVPGMGRQDVAEHRRDRVLKDDELRKLWAATADGSPFSALVRFLLATSARRSEAAAMKYDEVVDGIWVLPASRSKTKTEVVRPLSKAAQAILAELPRIGDHPFTSNGVTPIASFSGPKAALDVASGVTGWRLHDLRRSARSLLSRAGVNGDVCEKCLGHSRGDIVERYDRHSFIPEMRIAFEKLATLISSIVEPQDNVRALRR